MDLYIVFKALLILINTNIIMGLFVSPILENKRDAWESWTSAFKGSKKDEFDDFNKRYEITRHEVWLVETPKGPELRPLCRK